MLRRVIAENPSKFTYRGTGTYIVGEGEVAVVDPGPMLDSHRDALAAALAGERVTAICVTHCHSDHSPLAAWLREETGRADVRLRAAPAARPGRRRGARRGDRRRASRSRSRSTSPSTRTCASPTASVAATGPGWTITGVHTPGHTSNHMCFAFAEQGVLFPGDHVMGWSTTVVSPPDGDMAAYIESLRKVAGRRRPHVLADARAGDRRRRSATSRRSSSTACERERQVLDAVRVGRRPRSRRSSPCSTPTSTRSCTSRPAARCSPTSSSSSTTASVRVADGGRPRLASRYEPT